MSQSARNTPKFASFKPKVRLDNSSRSSEPKTSIVEASNDERSEHVHRGDREKRQGSYSTHSKHGHHERRRYREEHSDSEHRQTQCEVPGPSSKKGQEESRHALSETTQGTALVGQPDESNLYYTDVRGDPRIVEFGGLHRYDVPTYSSAGWGRIMGAPPYLKIDREASNHKSIAIRNAKAKVAGRPLTSRKDRSSARLKTIRPRKQDADFEAQVDFVALNSSLNRTSGSASPAADLEYRSVQGKAKTSAQPDDKDLQYLSESETDLTNENEELRVRQANANLVRQSKDHPENVAAWLALIDHQAMLVCPNVDYASFTNMEKRTLADMRISIYEQAMKKVSQDISGHGQLLAGLLKEGALLWDTSRLTTKWKDCLQQYPRDILLWTKYLDFVQTNHVTFRYEQCRAVYLRCLTILHKARSEAPAKDVVTIQESQLYVLLRFTTFIRDAGYDEFACSIWQIVLENRFHSPSQSPTTAGRLESLEAFWEADIPRIGEEGALGWKHFVENDGGNGEVRQASGLVAQTWDQHRPFGSFSRVEMMKDSQLHLPASIDDDSGDEDPFRFVLFSDLREIIAVVLDEFPPRALMSAFLTFMHFPPLHDLESQQLSSAWQIDPYLQTVLVLPNTKATNEARDIVISQTTIYALFQSGLFNVYLQNQAADSDTSGFLEFARKALEQILAARYDDILAEYVLAFTAHFFASSVRSRAKRLLKNRPNDLRLYNAYALVELRLGNFDKAREVWRAALEMCRTMTPCSDHEIVLRHTWVHAELDAGNDTEALQCLLYSGKAKITSEPMPPLHTHGIASTDRLRAVQLLQEGWADMLDKQDYQLAAFFADCLTWLGYLGSSYDLQPALDKLTGLSSTLISRSATLAAELLHQSKANLMHLHIKRQRSYKPASIRQNLIESLHLFPSNIIILSAYNTNEAQMGLTDRIRATLQNQDLSPESASLAQWIYTLSEELRRCSQSASGSTENSVRATFAHALLSTDSIVKHSSFLWEMWLSFEQSAEQNSGRANRQRAKQVFLDGLRFLPWHKRWIVLGLEVMEEMEAMDQAELKQVYEVLGEREMRVRHAGRLDNLLSTRV